MNAWIIAGVNVGAWLLASRTMFRRWDGGTRYATPVVIALAMVAGLFWPVMLAAGLVMWRAPPSKAELEARIKELETELDL